VSRTAVQQAQETLRKQQQKLDALLTLNEIDPAIQEHERTKLGELQQALIEAQAKLEQDLAVEGLAKANRASQIEEVRFEVTIAERDVQLARARLSTAIEKRKQLVESRGTITFRPSLLDPNVRLSPHSAPDILGLCLAHV
jgi:hypothetical protein